jgi:hypothetical protein
MTRRAMRIAVYLFLFASAATTFFLGEHLWAAARLGDAPIWAPLLAPVIFTFFVLLYTIDRWLAVRRRAATISRSVLQVALALIFLTLLWPPQATEYRRTLEAKQNQDFHIALLKHRDHDVRTAACELLGLRAAQSDSNDAAFLAVTALLERETSEPVKAACRAALAQINAAKPTAPSAP